MGKPTDRLTVLGLVSGDIAVYLMFDHPWQQIVMLTTIWWWQKLRKTSNNKQRSHRFRMEMFNLMKLNELEGKGQYHVGVSNRFAALKDLDAEEKVNSAF
jgi:hypothetical protein